MITGPIAKFGWTNSLANPQATLTKRGNRWMFRISDFNWEVDEFASPDIHSDCIEWTVKQLEQYPRVNRMAYDIWYFERKREAEQFQTLWLIKWS